MKTRSARSSPSRARLRPAAGRRRSSARGAPACPRAAAGPAARPSTITSGSNSTAAPARDRRHVLDGELDAGQLGRPAALELLDRVEHEVVELLGPAAWRGERARHEPPRRPRPWRSRAGPRDAVQGGGIMSGVTHAPSVRRHGRAQLPTIAINRVPGAMVRSVTAQGPEPSGLSSPMRCSVGCRTCTRTGCAALGGRHADLRLRRPDRRPRPAGDLRRAAHLRPVRGARRAAHRAARLGGACGCAGDPDAAGPSSDDLLALADAVREAGRPRADAAGRRRPAPTAGREVGRRGHLRVLPTRRADRAADRAAVVGATEGRPPIARTCPRSSRPTTSAGVVPDQLDEDVAARGRRGLRRVVTGRRRRAGRGRPRHARRPRRRWPRAFADGVRRRGRRRRR